MPDVRSCLPLVHCRRQPCDALARDEITEDLQGAIGVITVNAMARVGEAFEADEARRNRPCDVLGILNWKNRVVLSRKNQGRTPNTTELGKQVVDSVLPVDKVVH